MSQMMNARPGAEPEAGVKQVGETTLSLPLGWHLQTEWEAEHAYAEGYAAGFAAAEKALADEITRAVGVKPYDRRDVIRWLIRTTGQARRPEPYSSPANGTDLGVAEREMFGRLAA